jgi:formylglycine-generating enzyme required for sulfatase activity
VREWVEDTWAPGFTGASNDGSPLKAAPAAPAAPAVPAVPAALAAPGALRVARGGSYADGAARLRLSMREGLPANTRDSTTGFRIARELP